MITFGENLAAHTRRLTEDDRNRQSEGCGNNHNETANETDPNCSLNRAGGAPGRNKQADYERGLFIIMYHRGHLGSSGPEHYSPNRC